MIQYFYKERNNRVCRAARFCQPNTFLFIIEKNYRKEITKIVKEYYQMIPTKINKGTSNIFKIEN